MLNLSKDGETGLRITRRFDAPPQALWDAHANADLVRRWMLGPDGWRMAQCAIDTRPGGTLRIVWTNDMQSSFSMSGEILETEPPHRMLHVERMHLPDPTPDNVVETRFDGDGNGTLMTQTMTLPDAQTRNAMLDQGMAEGIEASYARLDALLAARAST